MHKALALFRDLCYNDHELLYDSLPYLPCQWGKLRMEGGRSMKRALCALLSLVMAVTGLSFSVTAQSAALLDGETSRTVRQLYDGVELTNYVLGSASKYKIQEFSTVEFDPSRDDLHLEVVGGDEWANQLVRTSDAVDRYNMSNGRGKTALAAVNGDMWLTSSTHARVEGSGTSYMGYSDPVVTKGLTIPRGFTMYGGEIICSAIMEQETPYNGSLHSFGINSDGEALLGDIVCEISIRNRSTDERFPADGINRLPADNALVVYTDKGYASNYSLADAYEVVIDCDPYAVKQGSRIRGSVVAIVKPGEEKYPMAENRIILTARGDRIQSLAGFKAGDRVTLDVDITDLMGNTEKWQSVTDCVGGYMPVIIDGVSTELGDTSYYPVSVLGIKDNGNVVMLTSYGRQGSSGYSYGFRIEQLDELCRELSIKTAFLLGGGSSASMTVLAGDEYELTGRPCEKNSDGTYGREQAVINSVILSYSKPKDDRAAGSASASAEAINSLLAISGENAKIVGYSLRLLANGEIDPNFQFSYMGADNSKSNISTITARTMGGDCQDVKLGIFVDVGDTYSPMNSLFKQMRFESTGEWQTKVIRLSDIDAWYGRIFGPEYVL